MNSLVKKIFVLIIFFSTILLFNSVFSYDNKTTHPALTDEIIDFYNLNFPNNPISNKEKEWIIQGSIDEDTPPRWINHFYDPIYKNGWSGEKTGIWSQSVIQYFSKFGLSNKQPVSSLNWLHNQNLQAKYGQYKGNRTWERAIYELSKKKNKKEAYYTLGFILHLIEDATVPDHTRNDTHAHELRWLTGDYGSPYEEYLKKYKRDNLNIAQNLFNKKEKPIILDSIDDYLIYLAKYSNKYFFSKDTINDQKYQYPKIIEDDGVYGYGKDENDVEFPLVKVEYKYILKGGQFKKIRNYYLPYEVKNSIILNAYFSRLSRKAVLAGAGIIKLFKDEAKRAEKENLTEPVKDSASIRSLVGKLYKITDSISQTYNRVKQTFNSVISKVFSRKNVGELINSQPSSNSQSFLDKDTNKNKANEIIDSNDALPVSIKKNQQLVSEKQGSLTSNFKIKKSSQSLRITTKNLNNPISKNLVENKNLPKNLTIDKNPVLDKLSFDQKLDNSKQSDNLKESNSKKNQKEKESKDLANSSIVNSSNNSSNGFSSSILILAGPDILNQKNKQEKNNQQFNQEGQNQELENNQEQNQASASISSFLEAPIILTNNGKDFLTSSSTIILKGKKPEDSEIFINNSNENITYSSSTLWQKEINLNPDENIFIVQAKRNEIESATTSIKIIFDNLGPNKISDLSADPGEEIGQVILNFSKPKDNYTEILKYLINISDGESEKEEEFFPNTSSSKESYVLNLDPEKIYSFEVFSFDKFNNRSESSNQVSIQPQTKANHLVINKVQIQKKEFVELYNPTDSDIDLSNFYFAIYSKNDNWYEPNNLRQFPETAKISKNGYYLIGFYESSSSTVDWQPYTSYRLSNENGAIAIFSENPKEVLTASSTLEEINSIKIDAFGWGSSKVFEDLPKSEIAQDYHLFKRKFLAFDTDNNNSDFIISESELINSKNFVLKERVKWALKLNKKQESSVYTYMALAPNKIIYLYAGNYLFAVDKEGNLKWKKQIKGTGSGFNNLTIGSDNSIYIGTDNGWFYRLDEEGNNLWQTYINGKRILYSTLSYDEKTIYLTEWGRLYSLNTKDGSINWYFSFSLPNSFPHRSIYLKKPAVSLKNENIYIPDDYQTNVYLYTILPSGSSSSALNLHSYLSYPSKFSSVKIDIDELGNESLYLGSGPQFLKIDPIENKVLWAKYVPEASCPDLGGTGGGYQPTNPIITSDSIFISGANIWVKKDRTIKSFFKNGEVKWYYCLDPEEFVKFATKDKEENIYAVISKSQNSNRWTSRLISFSKDGQINWQVLKEEKIFKIITAKPIVLDDLIFVAVENDDSENYLVALKKE